VLVLQEISFPAREANLKVAVRDLTISLQQEGVADLDIWITGPPTAVVAEAVVDIQDLGVEASAVLGVLYKDTSLTNTILDLELSDKDTRAVLVPVVIQTAQEGQVVPE
jgi:hypothetical protein